eukprot:804320-Prorocentrum_lima.AAC.1
MDGRWESWAGMRSTRLWWAHLHGSVGVGSNSTLRNAVPSVPVANSNARSHTGGLSQQFQIMQCVG